MGPPETLAAELVERLAGESRQRVGIDALLQMLVEQRPELATAPERALRLGEVLDRLEADGAVVPSKGRRLLLGVSLPKSVTRLESDGSATVSRTRTGSVENPARRYPWVPEMAWAASGSRRQPAEHERLVRLSQWIAAQRDQARPVVPVRERSLEVFGEDKRLEAMLDGVLQNREATVAALRVKRAHPPMAVQPVAGATGTDLLVVENGTAFRSVLEALAVHMAAGAPARFRYVGYGSGAQLEAIVPAAAELSPVPGRLDYFGDLDRDGLRFAAAGARRCQEQALPALQPAVRLYTMLLDRGRAQTKSGRSAAKEAQPWPPEGLAWLGPELANRVEQELGPGQWLAQEWVGCEALSADSTWCT